MVQRDGLGHQIAGRDRSALHEQQAPFGQGNLTGWDGYRFWTRQRKITSKWALQKDATWMS